MTKRALEFHDSTFKEIRHNTGDIEIVLDKAVVHESGNKPGYESGKVFTQQISIIISSPIIAQNSSQLNSDIYDGWISIDDEKFDNIIPLLPKLSGKISVMIALAHNEEKILIHGNAIEITDIGTAKYIEDFHK